MTSTIAPIDGITNDNHGGYVIVFAITAACVSIISALIRFGHAIRKQLRFGADDAFFILSLVFALMQALTIGCAVHNGLGRHTASLNDAQVVRFFKDTYTSRILAAMSMSCAKLSVNFLYKRLVLYSNWRINLIPLLSAAGWMIFSLFGLAFQCHLPSPWLISSSNCPTGPSLTIAVTVLNCLSDAILILYPSWAMWNVSMPTSSRLTVMALFSSRILVCIVAVIDVTYAARIFHSLDPTWDQFSPVVTGIVLVNLSLVIATVPRLHSFLSKIPSGQSSAQLRSFLLSNRLITAKRTETGAASNSQISGNSENTNSLKTVLSDKMVTNIGGIVKDKGNETSSSSTQSDSNQRAISVEYYVKGGQR